MAIIQPSTVRPTTDDSNQPSSSRPSYRQFNNQSPSSVTGCADNSNSNTVVSQMLFKSIPYNNNPISTIYADRQTPSSDTVVVIPTPIRINTIVNNTVPSDIKSSQTDVTLISQRYQVSVQSTTTTTTITINRQSADLTGHRLDGPCYLPTTAQSTSVVITVPSTNRHHHQPSSVICQSVQQRTSNSLRNNHRRTDRPSVSSNWVSSSHPSPIRRSPPYRQTSQSPDTVVLTVDKVIAIATKQQQQSIVSQQLTVSQIPDKSTSSGTVNLVPSTVTESAIC